MVDILIWKQTCSLFQSCQRDWDRAVHVFSFLALTLTVWKVSSDFRFGVGFLMSVLGRDRLSKGEAIKKIFKIMMVQGPSHILDFGWRRLESVRVVAELEILFPKIDKPEEQDYEPKEFLKIHKDWEDQELQRNQDIDREIKRYFYKPSSSAQEWMTHKIMFALRKKAKPGAPSLKSTGLSVHVAGFPRLDDSRPLIKKYFEELQKLNNKSFVMILNEANSNTEEENNELGSIQKFLISVEISGGYLSPLFLITGLVNRFSEKDGWQLILENYRKLVEDDKEFSESFRELRSFMFNCWLLWGPSVSPCLCHRWSPSSENQKENILIQYGYGDENNSFDLLVKNGRSYNFMQNLSHCLELGNHFAPVNKQAALHSPVAAARYAAPYSVTGKFAWGPNLPEASISAAQKLVMGGSQGQRRPLTGRILLSCDQKDIVMSPVKDSSRYYSAYLWIMFILINAEGEPFYSEQKWKNLLVYFEHGNIADASTYQSLKENLIAKIGSSLTEIFEREEDKEKILIRYACAFDDPNCSLSLHPENSGMFYSMPGRGGVTASGHARPVRLLDILKSRSADPSFLAHSSRLDLQTAHESGIENHFSSCLLPELVESFYRDLQPQ